MEMAMQTVKQVAKQLNISAAIVYGWVAAGVLASYRLGTKGSRGAIRIAETDLAVFIESLKTNKGQAAAKPTAPKCPIRLKHVRLKSS
jgi:excisionase family DNA binding protein